MTMANRYNHDLAQAKVLAGKWRVDPDAGLVYGVKGAPFRRMNSWGYIQIKFRDPVDYRIDHAVLAHRVIWEAVHGPLPDDLTINHINGRKTDNRLVNLEAVTQRENILHARRTGLMPVLHGTDLGTAKLTEDQVSAIYRRAWLGENQAAIGADYGVSREAVSNIKQGWSWTHVTGHQRTPAA